MKFSIMHQESYSRGELLLRAFFGILYIGIPHGLILFFLAIADAFVGFFAFWAILFTGKYPRGMFDFHVKHLKWNFRVSARMSNLVDGYPAFGMDAIDPKIVLEIPYPESVNRGTVLLRMFFGIFYVLIPHMIPLMFLAIGTLFAQMISFFAILFTGKFPAGMHKFIVGVSRWGLRVGLYMSFLTDTYPPFSTEETDPVNWDENKIEDHLVG